MKRHLLYINDIFFFFAFAFENSENSGSNLCILSEGRHLALIWGKDRRTLKNVVMQSIRRNTEDSV